MKCSYRRWMMTAVAGVALMALSVRSVMATPENGTDGPTEVLFFFDTEDFTCSEANDPVRDLANIFAEEGVKGHFAIVGYLCRQLVDWKRWDVIEALKPHLVGTQTLYHSVHPDICEISDLRDFDEAYHNVLVQEAQALGMIEAMTGKKSICAVPPGNSKTYVAMYVYADLGIPFYCDTVISDYWSNSVRKRHAELWYCNMRHMIYGYAFEKLIPGREKKGNETDWDSCFRFWKTRPRVLLYCHPNTANRKGFWDGYNYHRGNHCEWGKWRQVPARDPKDTEEYYRRVRAFIRRFKADPVHFKITNLEEIAKKAEVREPVTMKDVPLIRASLQQEFGPVEKPSLSVADCYQAAVRLLRGEKEYVPGKVYGFLEKPEGIASPVRLKRGDMVRAAKSIDLKRFLASRINVGEVTVGPADFLFAALELLETGKDEVEAVPREQLGDFEHFGMKALKTFSPARPDLWVHTPDFKDEYLGDRLRWQFWTLRYGD